MRGKYLNQLFIIIMLAEYIIGLKCNDRSQHNLLGCIPYKTFAPAAYIKTYRISFSTSAGQK